MTCHQREELQRDEREHCQLTKPQTINGAACLMAMMATLKTLDCKTLNLKIQILERFYDFGLCADAYLFIIYALEHSCTNVGRDESNI